MRFARYTTIARPVGKKTICADLFTPVRAFCFFRIFVLRLLHYTFFPPPPPQADASRAYLFIYFRIERIDVPRKRQPANFRRVSPTGRGYANTGDKYCVSASLSSGPFARPRLPRRINNQSPTTVVQILAVVFGSLK